MNSWVKVEDKLPPDKMYVLGRHNTGTWSDSDDQDNVNVVVVKLVLGKDMTTTKIGDTIRSSDKHGNNLKPYNWETFGATSFFGQDIECWMYIPEWKETYKDD